MKKIILVPVIVVLAIAIYLAAFVVKEGQQALIVQFGRIVGKPIDKAGLHWKLPVVQEVRFFEKRMLEWDGDPNQIPTKDKKYIWVDTTARWKIKDLVVFAQTLRTERQAQDKMDSILDGATRDVISMHNLVEAVRNSNSILDRIKLNRAKKAKLKKEAAAQEGDVKAEMKKIEVEEEITGEIAPIKLGREKLSQMIIDRARKELEPLGIELIDVQLRRIAYEKSVEAKVYDRMISERKRIAEKIRSIGKGEMAKIQGKLNKDLKGIESAAYRKSQVIKGKAEARAIAIYASALRQDSDFYKFQRSLEAYRNTLTNKSSLILSTDSAYLKYLK